MKNSVCFLCYFLCCLMSIQAQPVRNTIALNGAWRFMTDSTNTGQAQHWENGLPAKAGTVQVPHTWNVMKGLEDYCGLAWYEKTFTIPAQARNKQLRLKFDAVYHDAVIYLNGTQLATHSNAGYTTFYVDVTKQLASPMLIKNVKKLNDTTVQVILQNKDQLPSYTVQDFMVTWPDVHNKLLQQKLPALKPGETATVTLTGMNARAGFDICTPAGYRVISYPFVH